MTSRSASDPAKASFAVTVPTCLLRSLELPPAPALSPEENIPQPWAPAAAGPSQPSLETGHGAPGPVGARRSPLATALHRAGSRGLCPASNSLSPGAAPVGQARARLGAGKGWDSLGRLVPSGMGPAPAVGGI